MSKRKADNDLDVNRRLLIAATALLEASIKEISRLRWIEEAAKTVVSAAWTDRFDRLHGHATIVALEKALDGK